MPASAPSHLKHNLRLKLALAPHKLRSWPYKGAVALEETSAMGLKQWHVLDGWQYLGSVQPDEVDPVEATRVGLAKPQAGFDPDVYRILARHLTRTRKGLRPWPPSDRP